MHKIKVALCDSCDAYRDRFVTYLVQHKAKEMQVEAFSMPEIFEKTLAEKNYDIIIFGKGFETAMEAAKRQQQRYIYLRDTVPECVAEADTGWQEVQTRNAEVFRFQSMEAILHEVQVLAGNDKEYISDEVESGIEIIGVCAAGRHEMQLPFSMVLSSELSQKGKVLYLNFMEHQALQELFGIEGQYDMGDLILWLRSDRLQPEYFWKCVYEMEGFYYILPFSNPVNLRELTMEDYVSLLDFLQKNTDFETLVIDFGEGLSDFEKMLERCTSIACLTKSGYFYECQLRSFQSYIGQVLEGRLNDKVHVFDLPFSAKHIRGGTGVLRQLLWSEFGDFVRGLIRGVSYVDQ